MADIEVKDLKPGDRAELEIPSNGDGLPILRKATVLRVPSTTHTVVCLDEVLDGALTESRFESLSLNDADNKALDAFGMSDKKSKRLQWSLMTNDNGYRCKIKRLPKWEATLPYGSRKSTLGEAKIGERVRVFHELVSRAGKAAQLDSVESNAYVDTTVIGKSHTNTIIGWETSQAIGYDTFSKPTTSRIDNLDKYVSGRWGQDHTLCYILPPEVKSEVSGDAISNLQSAIKQIEAAVPAFASEEEKSKLNAELAKLKAVAFPVKEEPVAAKPKEVSVEKRAGNLSDATLTKLKDAKLGDTVEMFLDTKDGMSAGSKTDFTMKPGVVVGTTAYSVVVAWKEHPGTKISFCSKDTPTVSKVDDFADYEAFALFGGHDCYILPPEEKPKAEPKVGDIIPVSDAKIGTRVKVFYTAHSGNLSSKKTRSSFEATVIGGKTNVLLGLSNDEHAIAVSKCIPGTMAAAYTPQKNIKVENKIDYPYVRWAPPGIKCEVLPAKAEVKKDEDRAAKSLTRKPGTYRTAKVGDNVELFLRARDKCIVINSTYSSGNVLQAKVIGKALYGELIFGRKGSDGDCRDFQRERAHAPADRVSDFEAYDYTWQCGGSPELFIVEGEPEPIKADATSLGDKVKIYLDEIGNYSAEQTVHAQITATVVGKEPYGSTIYGWKKDEVKPNQNYAKSEYSGNTTWVSNIDEFVHFKQTDSKGNAVCIMVEPAPKPEQKKVKAGSLKLGSKVKMSVNADGSYDPTYNAFTTTKEATIVGRSALGPLLGWKKGEEPTKFGTGIDFFIREEKYTEVVPNLDEFVHGWSYLKEIHLIVVSEPDVERSVVPPKKKEEEPKPKEALFDLKDRQLGDRIKIFLYEDGGFGGYSGDDNTNDQKYPCEATIVGKTSGGSFVIGWKAGETIPSSTLYRRSDYLFKENVPNIDEYSIFRCPVSENKVALVKAAEPTPPKEPETKPEETTNTETKEMATKEETKSAVRMGGNVKVGDLIEIFLDSDNPAVAYMSACRSKFTTKVKVIGIQSGGNVVLGSKSPVPAKNFKSLEVAIGGLTITDKVSDFDTYTSVYACGNHCECYVLPPEPKTVDAGKAVMIFGAIACALLSAACKTKATNVRVAEVVEEKEEAYEVDVSELEMGA